MGKRRHLPRLPFHPWVRSCCFWLNHQDGAHRTPKNIPRGPRRIQREWPCSGAAPPLHVLRTRWIGDVHPTYSGEGPSRTNSQGVTHSRDAITVPTQVFWVDAPRSIFHASEESSIGPSPHEPQSLLFSVNHLCGRQGLVSFFSSTPVPGAFRSHYT